MKLVLAFELYKEFRFRLKAGNGEFIASSGAYEMKANAKNGVDPVRKSADDAPVVDLAE